MKNDFRFIEIQYLYMSINFHEFRKFQLFFCESSHENYTCKMRRDSTIRKNFITGNISKKASIVLPKFTLVTLT